eukprot:5516074-Pyramimonas_sp.AAC.1
MDDGGGRRLMNLMRMVRRGRRRRATKRAKNLLAASRNHLGRMVCAVWMQLEPSLGSIGGPVGLLGVVGASLTVGWWCPGGRVGFFFLGAPWGFSWGNRRASWGIWGASWTPL